MAYFSRQSLVFDTKADLGLIKGHFSTDHEQVADSHVVTFWPALSKEAVVLARQLRKKSARFFIFGRCGLDIIQAAQHHAD
ncbi:hypothetical protein WJX84_006888 [Apatococcus fuscideae]|uniref:Uncharacterized protein n=1 Tax=Apatococcus fuscideae TaxID=2026836 RepID=A0AAW1RQ97_9CHLO